MRLTPRLYSISSSPLVSPHEVQLTVSVVLPGGVCSTCRVCSTFLADPPARPVFLQRSPHFRPPEDGATPMIMVGAGTGIAPFRGFLQERRALGHTGRNWLFFGDRHRDENFYYRDDLADMAGRRLADPARSGLLPRSGAANLRAAQDDRARRAVVALAAGRGARLRLRRRRQRWPRCRRGADEDHRDPRAALRRRGPRLQARSWSPRSAICATCTEHLTAGYARGCEHVVTPRSSREAKAQQ